MNRLAVLGLAVLGMLPTACSSASAEEPVEVEGDDTVAFGSGGATVDAAAPRTDAAASRTDAAASRTDAAASRTDAAASRTDAATPRKDAASGGGQGTGGSTAPTPDAAPAARPKIGDTNSFGLKLVWAEEFDGPKIDYSIWHDEIRQGYNNEEEYLTDSPDNQFIDDGNLVIRAIPSTKYAGANYTSAFLTSKGTKFFKYGYLEARVKMPMAQGCWPAFWLRSEDQAYGGWPASGEIDIMEYWRYDTNTIWGTAIWDNGGMQYSQKGIDLKVDPADDFHVAGLRWTETLLEWYVDGTRYFSFDISQPFAGRRPYSESFYIVLNLAVGGGRGGTPAPAQWPDDYRVDWVRVWQ
jgi:beta-glucanase (GH16 family)